MCPWIRSVSFATATLCQAQPIHQAKRDDATPDFRACHGLTSDTWTTAQYATTVVAVANDADAEIV
jgi:hypothetical protein